ncbi:MAG: caspase family protein [Saprospiraceae bacterium]|nr:caspase family protein [Saprospiraceae bacterium]
MKYIVIFMLLPFLAFSQSKGVSPIANSQQPTAMKNTYAVVVGISDYQDKDIPDLRFADKDAEAFANFLRSPAGGSLDNEHLKVLMNHEATAGRVAEALDALLEKTKEDDQVLIYFSGHGDVERKTVSQPGFLLCWDAPSRVYMGGGTYSLAYLQEVVTTLSTQNKAKVIVITDACHAGKLAGSQIGGAQLTAANLAKQYTNEVKILSCQPGELSLEGEQWGGGRGIFSYYMVEGLFGLADKNADGYVTLGELDRYLEDHVTTEAAPQSQVPILLGNKTDRLVKINPQILADLKKTAGNNMAIFAAIEGRGIEEEILGKLDSNTQQLYVSFKNAVAGKRFFKPENDCAEKYFAQLETNQSLAQLHGIIKHNYAAALQDDAQQVMNIWLQADVQQLECIGKTLKLDPIPRQLQRAAELLGESHYMYRSLQARKLLFEGILVTRQKTDVRAGRAALKKYEQSLALEPNSPLSWHNMIMIYALNLNQIDSAFYCAEAAHHLAPNWVLPYVDLADYLTNLRKYDLADKALKEAETIDSLHAYTINRRGLLLLAKGDISRAINMMEKYNSVGGPTYPCWHNNYGNLLMNVSKYAEAEAEFWKAVSLDSTTIMAWSNLGSLYNVTNRYSEAEKVLLKAYSLDSSSIFVLNNLGAFFKNSKQPEKALIYFNKLVGLDSTIARSWSNLGSVYIDLKKYDKAEECVERANKLDTMYVPGWLNRGNICRETGRWDCAENFYNKAMNLNPGFASTYLNYAVLKAKLNDAPAATYYAEQAILKGLNFLEYYSTENFNQVNKTPEWKALMEKYFSKKLKE